MRSHLIVLSALLVGSLACGGQPETLDTDPLAGLQNGDVIEGRYIVVLDTKNETALTSLSVNQVEDLAVDLAWEVSEFTYDHVYATALQGFAINASPEAADALARDSRVLYIEPDRVVRASAKPPWAGGGGGGDTDPAQEVSYGTTRVGGAGNGAGLTAWILDSGIDLDHADLNVNAAAGFNAFTSGKDGKSLDDGNGHGTHTAGTVGAKDNSIGTLGVAAGATVVPVKVLGSRGSGSYSGVIAGVNHVAANGSAGDVANMSIGGPESQALEDALLAAAATVPFAVSAGNESTDACSKSPAGAGNGDHSDGVVVVSAHDSNDNWASFSNYGTCVDVSAPGVGIISTWKGGGTKTISGTSMSSPHVAGVMLLGGGSYNTDGTVNGDPDGNADAIAHR